MLIQLLLNYYSLSPKTQMAEFEMIEAVLKLPD